jgi:Na+:H+ antiporter, NhaA family
MVSPSLWNLTPSTPAERIKVPFRTFFERQSSGGMLLLVCTLTALVWANSPWAESYHHLWEYPIGIEIGSTHFTFSLHHWINDGLMAVFFLLVGLEIKREALVGELASVRRATLPIAAAVGGMVVPALVYTAINAGGPGAHGWGVPMATDIAFALAVLAVLGSRVPLGIKVFLTALAIVDDIGAVLVIAFFYTDRVSPGAIAAALLFLSLAVLANVTGVRGVGVYAALGIGLWVAVLYSGVHATVAGVLLAMTIPARTRIDPGEYLTESRRILDQFERSGRGEHVMTSIGQQAALLAIERASAAAQAPLAEIEHRLHPWVAFGIVPLFALANAGLDLRGGTAAGPGNPVTLGILLGLVVGKPLGILALSWLSVRVGAASLPQGVGWGHVHGVAWLGGIGFTMALFVSGLAFGGDAELLNLAKVGVLGASVIAGTAGTLLLLRQRPVADAYTGAVAGPAPPRSARSHPTPPRRPPSAVA